jgi:lipopolysaccharide biosynthesis glycosyltransferase
MLGITVNSLIERADPEKQYDIIILDSGLSARRQEQIKALSAQSLHVNIRFITLPSFSLGSGQFFRAQWSFATYNRLLLTELLPYDKIVYLDCDLIVCDDIAKLFAVDIGEALLGAVPDFFVTAEYRKGGEHDIAGRWMTLGQYYKDLLQQSVSSEETFYQAGVLLFNLKKLKKIDASKRFLDLFYRKNPQFGVDQDILNVVCFGQIRPIDYRWNVVNHTDGYLASIASLLSKTEVQQLKQSAANPGCIHFTGAWLAKPFNSLVDFTQYSELFWEEARKTRWYEETLSRALSRDLNRISGQLSHHVSNEMNRIGELSLRRTIRRKLKPILTRCNRFLPSAVREKLKLVPKLQSFYRKVSA